MNLLEKERKILERRIMESVLSGAVGMWLSSNILLGVVFMFNFLLKIIKPIPKALSFIWRWISPNQENVYAQLARQLAYDRVRAWLSKNPKVDDWTIAISDMVRIVRSIIPLPEPAAESVIRSILFDLGIDTYKAGYYAGNHVKKP
jgi:hypothetical protein